MNEVTAMNKLEDAVLLLLRRFSILRRQQPLLGDDAIHLMAMEIERMAGVLARLNRMLPDEPSEMAKIAHAIRTRQFNKP